MNTIIDVIIFSLLYFIGVCGALRILRKSKAPMPLNVQDIVGALIWPILLFSIILRLCTSCVWPRWAKEKDCDDMEDEYK